MAKTVKKKIFLVKEEKQYL